jgi:hypothetical protein
MLATLAKLLTTIEEGMSPSTRKTEVHFVRLCQFYVKWHRQGGHSCTPHDVFIITSKVQTNETQKSFVLCRFGQCNPH